MPFLLVISILGAPSPPQRQTEEETYQFDAEDVSRMDVRISYGLGELVIERNIRPDEIQGTIEYQPRYMRPDVDYRTIGSKGILDITVRSLKKGRDDEDWSHGWDWRGFKKEGFESSVDFKLPQGIPIDLDMDFGLGEATLDFSRLSVSDFKLNCGLSDVRVSMETPNPVSCRKVTIESGLGDFDATGLGNLRTKEFDLEVGLGSADVDFSGDIIDDMEGEIDVGLGSLDLTFPDNINIRLDIDRTFLSSIDVNGLVKEDGEWVTRDWDRHRPTLQLEINVGLGTVDVDVRH